MSYIAEPRDDSDPVIKTSAMQAALTNKQDAAAFLTTLVGIGGTSGSGNLARVTGPTISQPTIDNLKLGYTTTATSAGTLTLTAASNNQQFFTGSTTHTVVLPVASTMTVGQQFILENNSMGVVTVNSSGSNLVVAIVPGTSVKITCILASGTSAASWDIEYVGFATVTGTGSNVLSISPTFSGFTSQNNVTLPGIVSSVATFQITRANSSAAVELVGGPAVLRIDTGARVTLGPMFLATYTVATLPAASTNTYAEANVSDALSPTMGSTVASGGSVKTKVRSNGTNWTVCGI